MKKMTLFLLLIFFGVNMASADKQPSVGNALDAIIAKQTVKVPSTKKELEQFLRSLIKREKIPPSQPPAQPPSSGPSSSPQPQHKEKPWQLVTIVQTPKEAKWGHIDDDHVKIEDQMKKGNLDLAVILYSREEGDTYLKVISKMVALSPNTSDIPQHEYHKVDNSLSEAEILDTVFSVLSENQDSYYTGFSMTIHGGADFMASHIGNRKHKLYISTIINAINKSKLHIDLFDWESCYMGTIGNVYELMTKTDIRYLITSSNADLAKTVTHYKGKIASLGPDLLLNVLHLSPENAAKSLAKEGHDVRGGAEFTFNRMLVDGDLFRRQTVPQLQTWKKALNANFIQVPNVNNKAPFNVYSFTDYLEKLIKRAPQDSPLQKESQNLLNVANAGITSYWCRDTANHKFTKIKDISGNGADPCIKGFGVTEMAIRQIQ